MAHLMLVIDLVITNSLRSTDSIPIVFASSLLIDREDSITTSSVPVKGVYSLGEAQMPL